MGGRLATVSLHSLASEGLGHSARQRDETILVFAKIASSTSGLQLSCNEETGANLRFSRFRELLIDPLRLVFRVTAEMNIVLAVIRKTPSCGQG